MKKAPQEAADAKAKAEAAQAKREAEQVQLNQRKTTSKDPCTEKDDADWYTASSSMLFDDSDSDLTATALLLSLQQQLFLKLRAHYQAVVPDYFDMIKTEDVSYKRQHIEQGGLRVINEMVSETYENCRETTDFPNSNGQYTMYMSIKINKKEIVDNIVDEIKKDEEMKVRFNEQQFRKSFEKFFEGE